MRALARLICLGLLLGMGQSAQADVPKNLPYPDKENITALEIIRQVYYTNHFYGFDNFMIRRKGRTMTVILNKDSSGKVNSIAIERYLNNNYNDGIVNNRDLAIFRSGKLKGTGLLVTDYVEEDKDSNYMVWLPALRKIRRFAQPAFDDSYGGAVFTYGDVLLREPRHENHDLLTTKTFEGCLGSIQELQRKRFKYAGILPPGSCRHQGKEVYVVKSTTKFENWWYDFRISFIDTLSFADYRTVYFKDGKLVKVIDRDWGVVKGAESTDPRKLFWKYWYGLDLRTGNQTWAVVPQDVISYNTERKASFWSEKTLRRLKR